MPPKVIQEHVEDTLTLESGTIVYEGKTEEVFDSDSIEMTGSAVFYKDSVFVTGKGFIFSRNVDYNVVRVLFDDDGNIIKVETMANNPWKQIDKNTIYLLRGANLSSIARTFGVTKEKLLRCNNIKNPNHIEAFTKVKLNCND